MIQDDVRCWVSVYNNRFFKQTRIWLSNITYYSHARIETKSIFVFLLHPCIICEPGTNGEVQWTNGEVQWTNGEVQWTNSVHVGVFR